jgi:tRNA threonylcarbamoyladenosine modification (KEOPS) complex  Pcc1 subunit
MLRHTSIKVNHEESARTIYKATHIDQSVGAKIRSKIQTTCNLSVQSLFFPLNDVVSLKSKGRFDDKNLEL